ncbi:uncharacterized protein KY384_005376 [Bacidia gigantensis]|uniref:uncharacterized protein n=1 Tax=Bacidia gigantensis TaxID=2732470 RepID=UPI001D0462BB|nr:uncharacterized protein KY384_005376 [Bacidia gigantensis]KAG8529895.1 hypothetical protein KY384_005376 [Bacidia gigantensis]
MATNTVERLAENLQAPLLDDRSYRVVRLPNKLEALLVHDPDTDKASASVSVDAGSFSDADDMPGMAHAVEHLLFMGTKKYPVENEYSRYLTAHSGYSNAYTASTQTNYYFEVSSSSQSGENGVVNGNPPSPLYGALDRFAQFFISPLFLSSTLDRELKAVDSENKKNLQSDAWRLRQLDHSLSNSKHPYHHFSTGNLETLRDEPRGRGLDIRKEFINFHDKHYSANRTKLVVLGKENLDELEQWVAEFFAPVHNKDLPQNRWDDARPYTLEQLGTTIFAKPVMDSRSIDLSFPFLDEEHLYDTQPSRYISHLIGHEGPGSILAYIKGKGWANGLSAGAMPVCPGTAFFSISIRLTEEGLRRYKDVVEVVFEYVSLIKAQSPQKWIMDEVKGMAEVDFKFREKTPASSFASSMSSIMQKPLPREWLLSGLELIRKFDEPAISKAMAHIRPDNFRLTVVSRDFPGDWNQKEKWYGTEYKVERFDAAFMTGLEKAASISGDHRIPDLHLPHRNEFIPSNLDVEKKEIETPSTAPKLIRNDESMRIWWKKDDTFWVPRGSVHINFRNPLPNATPACMIKSRLFCELVKDALVEYSYDAEISGLDYHLSNFRVGLGVDIAGYNDKMPVLLEKVLLCMRDLEVKSDRFGIVKERLLRGYRKYDFQQPYKQVGDYTSWLIVDQSWIVEHLIAELQPLTVEDVATFFPQLLRQLHVEMFCHGNIYKEDALKMADLIEKTFNYRALPASQWQVRRNVLFAPGDDFTYQRKLDDPANVNNCIEYYLPVGAVDDRTARAKLSLLSQLTDELGFDQLRTKEQLGYVVWTGSKINNTTMGYRVIIQSERSVDYLEERINAFLSLFGKTLEEMSAEEFQSHKRSLINKRLEKLKNLSQETSRIWTYIQSEYYDFFAREAEANYIEPLTKPEMIEFFKHYIDPSSPTRAKLSVHLKAQVTPKSIAGSMTPAEQKEKVLSVISKSLTAAGIEANLEHLQKVFEDVDVAGGDRTSISNAIREFLSSNNAMSEDQVSQLMEQVPQLLGTLLPGLGIEMKPEADAEDAEAELPPAPKVKRTTYVDDVREYRSRLAVSAGPVPINPLSDYEDFEPKL